MAVVVLVHVLVVGAIGYVAVRLLKRFVRQAVEEALDSRRAGQPEAASTKPGGD